MILIKGDANSPQDQPLTHLNGVKSIHRVNLADFRNTSRNSDLRKNNVYTEKSPRYFKK